MNTLVSLISLLDRLDQFDQFDQPGLRAADDPQLHFVPLTGSLLTMDGEDLITGRLGSGPAPTLAPVQLARSAAEIARIGAGMRTLAVVRAGSQPSELDLVTVVDGWNLVRAHGERLDLRGASLTGAALAGANLRGADLSDADLRGADLTDAVLRGARLDGADLRGAFLARANLIEVSAEAADLRRADLSNCDLKGARLARAALRGAELWAAFGEGAQLDEAYVDGADLTRLSARDPRPEPVQAGGR